MKTYGPIVIPRRGNPPIPTSHRFLNVILTLCGMLDGTITPDHKKAGGGLFSKGRPMSYMAFVWIIFIVGIFWSFYQTGKILQHCGGPCMH